MGSENWATQAAAKVKRLVAVESAVRCALVDFQDKKEVDMKALEASFEHAWNMYCKRRPSVQQCCDSCGWPPARLVGQGYAFCEDCYPKEQP